MVHLLVWVPTHVDVVARKLPALSLLYGLGFDEADRYFLSQSYDAGRGLLSNVLLQVLKRTQQATFRTDHQTMKLYVTETLRFDPPIHNTRRGLTEDMEIAGQLLTASQHVLLVLAAANRDPQTFVNPSRFSLERANNGDHLTFGAGAHACIARQLTVGLVADTIWAMLERHPDVRQVEDRLEYEPLINARLPQRVRISYSN